MIVISSLKLTLLLLCLGRVSVLQSSSSWGILTEKIVANFGLDIYIFWHLSSTRMISENCTTSDFF